MLVPSFFSWIALLYGMDLVRAVSIGTIVLWLFISMVIEATQDDPAEAESPKAMTNQQAGVLIGLVVMLFFLSTCIVIVTPFWLTEGAVLKMAAGWISLVANIIWRSPIALWVGLVIVGLFFIFRFARYVIGRVQRLREREFRYRRDKHTPDNSRERTLRLYASLHSSLRSELFSLSCLPGPGTGGRTRVLVAQCG